MALLTLTKVKFGTGSGEKDAFFFVVQDRIEKVGIDEEMMINPTPPITGLIRGQRFGGRFGFPYTLGMRETILRFNECKPEIVSRRNRRRERHGLPPFPQVAELIIRLRFSVVPGLQEKAPTQRTWDVTLAV